MQDITAIKAIQSLSNSVLSPRAFAQGLSPCQLAASYTAKHCLTHCGYRARVGWEIPLFESTDI